MPIINNIHWVSAEGQENSERSTFNEILTSSGEMRKCKTKHIWWDKSSVNNKMLKRLSKFLVTQIHNIKAGL